MQELWTVEDNNCGTITIYVMQIRKKRNRRNIWSNNPWEFSEINGRHQTTYPEGSENIKMDMKKPGVQDWRIFKLQNIQTTGNQR